MNKESPVSAEDKYFKKRAFQLYKKHMTGRGYVWSVGCSMPYDAQAAIIDGMKEAYKKGQESISAIGVMVQDDQEKWYCESHPEHEMGHDGCGGAGILECARIPMLAHLLRIARQETREACLFRDDVILNMTNALFSASGATEDQSNVVSKVVSGVTVPDGFPIETAPKDGTYILVTNEEAGGWWVAHYKPVATSGYRFDNPWLSVMINHWHLPNHKTASSVPTKWMPLPPSPPPAQSKEDQEN